MTLSGLGRVSAKPRGGITAVEIVPARAFRGAGYDSGTGCFTSVDTSEPFAAYVFREDRATYTEEASGPGSEPLVKHVLKMEFPAGEETNRAVAELSAPGAGGFIAVVSTGAGKRLLAGYSTRFCAQYPFRVVKTASVSGSSPSDFPSVEVTLESIDTEFSKPLFG